ncbi:MAG: hypothetical protein IH991_01260 [Planctomycetes bacterium]|nr:hypothetical protein [Planctomycetota bacterium]
MPPKHESDSHGAQRTSANEDLAPGTRLKVAIHWIKGELRGQVAYTIHGIVSGLQIDPQRIGIAIRKIRYPNGNIKQASGLTYYDRERVEIDDGQLR